MRKACLAQQQQEGLGVQIVLYEQMWHETCEWYCDKVS
jgi:hypothetical protein